MLDKSKIESLLDDNVITSNAKMKISLVNGDAYHIGNATDAVTGDEHTTTYLLEDDYVVLTIETYCDSETEGISKIYIPYEHIVSISFTIGIK